MTRNVWLIKRSTMGGSEYLNDVYSNEEAALLKCEDLEEEWGSYHPEKARGEVISGGRIIVKGMVHKISSLDVKTIHRQRGLAKLSDAEVDALGLSRS